MATDISNMDDVIDSRDVIARIVALEEERDALAEAIKDAEENAGTATDVDAAHEEIKEATEALTDWNDSNGDELNALKALAEQASGYAADWEHGETLIRDSYFKDYAQELAEDLGTINSDVHWPYTCIDWDRAARELRMDYTAVEFDGVTYWVR